MDHPMTPDLLPPSEKPSWRKPAGIFMMIGLIALVAVIVVSLSSRIATLPGIVQALIYMTAGVVWIVPMGPLLLWMETGKWRI